MTFLRLLSALLMYNFNVQRFQEERASQALYHIFIRTRPYREVGTTPRRPQAYPMHSCINETK